MITEKQKLFLSYFLSRASFLGIGFSLMYDKGLQDTWICTLLGFGLGLLIVFIYQKILEYKKSKTLKEVLDTIKGGLILKVLIIIFSYYIVFQTLTTLETFITSFFLIITPPFYVILPLIILTGFITSKGIHNIAKVSESLFFFAVTIPLIIIASLFKYTELLNFLPMLTINKTSFLYTAIMFGVFTSVPYLFLLNVKNDGKNLVKMYLFNAFAVFIIIVAITAIFGPALTNIYRYPEYMVLKRIKAMSFIEKIENIVSTIWIFDEFIMLSLASFTIYSLLPPKHNKKIGITLAILMFYITGFLVGENYSIILFIYYKVPWIYLSAFFLIVIPLFWKIKKDG